MDSRIIYHRNRLSFCCRNRRLVGLNYHLWRPWRIEGFLGTRYPGLFLSIKFAENFVEDAVD